MPAITRLGLGGFPAAAYPDFLPKTAAPQEEAEQPQVGGWAPRRKPGRSAAEIEREREERWLAKQRQERDLETELATIYDRLHGLTLPPAEAEAIAADVATAVAPFVEASAGPSAQSRMAIDWSALAADAQAVRTMLDVARRLRLDRIDDENNRLLAILLMAS